VIGTFKLIPSTLALSAVQRHSAASKSAKPWINAQHLLPEGGFPIITLTNPKRSAQTPSFKVSLGHWPWDGGEVLGEGVGFGDGGHETLAWVNVE
jgi:hypothetical protein